jgi:hypothetical protein
LAEALRQGLFGNGAPDTAVAVLEWMDRFEVEMRDSRACERRQFPWTAGAVWWNQRMNRFISAGTFFDGGASK